MIVYPDDNFDSWIDEDGADLYFETRLHADPWDAATDKSAALVTAFHSLNELDLTVDPTDTAQLDALQRAQCEQALYELEHNPEGPGISGLSIAGLLSVKTEQKSPPPRYSQRAVAILRPYLTAPSIKRTR